MLNYPLQAYTLTRNKSLSDSFKMGYFFLRDDGSCTCVNKSAAAFIGELMQESCGLVRDGDLGVIKLKDYLTCEDKLLLDEHIRCCTEEKDDVVTILNILRPDGFKQLVQLSSPSGYSGENYKHGYLTIIIILNDSQPLQEDFERLEELNLVGKIAGSVAHEVRNPLTVVRGHLQLLSWDDNLNKYNEKLDTMILEIDRAVEILTELLYLSRPTESKLERQNINDVLNKLFQLLNAEALVNSHELIYELEPVPDVMLDKKRFRQVVLNLVNNGFQSMENHSSLIVRTYADAGKVYFSVKDHGKGIPPEVLNRIGTPFFTTKTNGTGLGLASCYNIVAQHGASMEIDTGPEGTTFTIIFDQV